MRYPRLSLLVLSSILLILAGCSQEQSVLAPAAPGAIRIVSSLPSKGVGAARTAEIIAAIKLAISERGGSAGGLRVEYVPLEGGSDESGDWSRKLEQSNAEAAAGDPSVVAYIGPLNTGATMVSLPITNKAGLLQAGPSVTWPGLTTSGWDTGEPDKYFPTGERTFIRMMPPDSAQADAATEWAADAGLKKVAVVDDRSSYSAGMADEFVRGAARHGITITMRFSISPQAPDDMRTGSASSDAVFYAPSSVGNAVSVAVALEGSTITVLSTDTALDPQFIEIAGPAANNWMVVSNSAPPGSNTRSAPNNPASHIFPSQFAANSYDITNLILDGLDAGTGRDRSALIRYILGAKRQRSGTLYRQFTDSGDPTAWLLSGYTWNGHTFTFNRGFNLQP